VTVQTKNAKLWQDILLLESFERKNKKSSSAEWDERKRAPAQIRLN